MDRFVDFAILSELDSSLDLSRRSAATAALVCFLCMYDYLP